MKRYEDAVSGMAHRGEELANALTHGVGAIASILALSILVVLAARGGDPFEIVSVAIFGATLLILYTASTLYHAARTARAKARLKVFDHCAIYLLIAGTYTPFTLGVLRGGWGWSLFGVVWGLAVAGVTFKLFFTGRFRLVSTIVYIGMGWLGLIAAGPLVREMTPLALIWLVGGGFAYTAGTPFYHSNRLRYSHAVWHAFVLTGSVCHVVAVGLIL
jgi:hemolysin III